LIVIAVVLSVLCSTARFYYGEVAILHRLGKAKANSVDFRVLDEICGALDCQPGDLFIRVANGSSGARVKAEKTAKKGARTK